MAINLDYNKLQKDFELSPEYRLSHEGHTAARAFMSRIYTDPTLLAYYTLDKKQEMTVLEVDFGD